MVWMSNSVLIYAGGIQEFDFLTRPFPSAEIRFFNARRLQSLYSPARRLQIIYFYFNHERAHSLLPQLWIIVFTILRSALDLSNFRNSTRNFLHTFIELNSLSTLSCFSQKSILFQCPKNAYSEEWYRTWITFLCNLNKCSC